MLRGNNDDLQKVRYECENLHKEIFRVKKQADEAQACLGEAGAMLLREREVTRMLWSKLRVSNCRCAALKRELKKVKQELREVTNHLKQTNDEKQAN